MRWVDHIQQALNSQPVRTIEPGGRTHAAVAVVLEEKPEGMNLLFIERAVNELDHFSGQIGLPGGRREHGDACPNQTALRETREEVGLDLTQARYLGRLHDFVPAGLKIVISCFVYAVESRPTLWPDPKEIADAFWFPVQEIGNPVRCDEVKVVFRARVRRFPAVQVGKKEPLWGITYRLLRNLDKTVARNSSGAVSFFRQGSGTPHLGQALAGGGRHHG